MTEQQRLARDLLTLAQAYSAATGNQLSTVGKKTMLLKHSFFPDIAAGALPDFKVQTFDRVVAWFDKEWPNEAIWPKGISRPSRRRT